MQSFLENHQKKLLFAGAAGAASAFGLYFFRKFIINKSKGKAIKPKSEGEPLKFLTQLIAEKRASLISSPTYRLLIKQTLSNSYSGLLHLTFRLLSLPTSPIHLDFNGQKIQSVQINFQPHGSYSEFFNGYNVKLPTECLKLGENIVTIFFENVYTNDGNGYHSFVDTDNKRYCYTNFEPDHCRKWFPCFDQPDLKGTLDLTVITPNSWKVISNETHFNVEEYKDYKIKDKYAEFHSSDIDQIIDGLDESFEIHTFIKTKSLSTYLFALITGPYIEFKCENSFKNIPMSVYCRESLAQYMEVQKSSIFEFLNKGIEFFEGFFGYAYPFSKYDQIFCPEFNVGAMENPGAVTFNDTYYIFKGDSTPERVCRRGRTIVHELAHMWFGDLVTMKWWNDLWLNESFADFAAITCLKNCKFTFPVSDFEVVGHLMKSWGYREDQLETTHPIAGEVKDTVVANSIFDGITYSKGSSVVLQLYYLMGHEPFSKALESYFKRFEWKNTVLLDFIEELNKFFKGDFDLKAWYTEWICTAGLNECQVIKRLNNQIVIEQRAALSSFPTLRRHKMKVAFYAKDGSFFTKDIILANESETPIECSADSYVAVLPNYKDETFIKVCLDPDSIIFFKENLNIVKEAGARILIWRSFFDMVRDAKIPSFDFFELVERFLPSENEFTLLEYVFLFSEMCIHSYTPSSYREKYYHILFQLVKGLLLKLGLAPENIAILKNRLIGFAKTKEDLEQTLSLLNKKNDELKFLTLNLENEWEIVKKVVFSPHFATNIKQETLALLAEKDTSDLGVRNKLKCETVFLNQEGRAKLWVSFANPEPNLSEKTIAAQMNGFNCELMAKENEKYFGSYFALLSIIFENQSLRYAETFLSELFPVTEDFDKVVLKIDDILKITPEKLSQMILQLKQERDAILRKKRCYEKFLEKGKKE